jgi:hypothetical protein
MRYRQGHQHYFVLLTKTTVEHAKDYEEIEAPLKKKMAKTRFDEIGLSLAGE